MTKTTYTLLLVRKVRRVYDERDGFVTTEIGDLVKLPGGSEMWREQFGPLNVEWKHHKPTMVVITVREPGVNGAVVDGVVGKGARKGLKP